MLAHQPSPVVQPLRTGIDASSRLVAQGTARSVVKGITGIHVVRTVKVSVPLELKIKLIVRHIITDNLKPLRLEVSPVVLSHRVTMW